MDEVIKEVFDVMVSGCNKDIQPIDLIKTGVDVLHKKNIHKDFTFEILKAVLKKIANGNDGISGTEDDLLSQNTIGLLIILIDSELIDVIITGVVSGSKKVTSKCWSHLW